jgi:sugar porter (SP) family MFS transporter
MNSKLLFSSLTVALAGFIFGFDTVVISGANLPIKELWQTTPFFHGTFIMSMALWGTVVGCLLVSLPMDRIGRKKTLLWIGILFTVSAIGTSLAWDPYSFSFFRFIGGIGIGASSVACPTYLTEVAPPQNRGRMVALYQFMIVFGILIAFISNWLLVGVGGTQDWRYMLGMQAVPSILYMFMVLAIFESPRWLYVNRGDETAATEVMKHLGVANPQAEIAAIRGDASQTTASLFGARYNKLIGMAFMLAFFNQLSGINFVLYYAPEILARAGLGAEGSLFSSISLGLVNLIFTYVGVYLIDRMGRRSLMIWGSIGYIVSLIMVAYAFYAGSSAEFLVTFICMFIASHAIGQGAVIWVFLSEIFPTQVRAAGNSFGSGTHWVFAAIITLVTPIFLDKDSGIFKDNPWPIFVFFALFMVGQLLWVLFVMPETKGKSVEQLEKELIG